MISFELLQDHIESAFHALTNWEYAQDQLNLLKLVSFKGLKEIRHHPSALAFAQPAIVTFWTRKKLNFETHHPIPRQKLLVIYSNILPLRPYFSCPHRSG